MKKSSNYLLLILFALISLLLFPGVECNKSAEQETDWELCGDEVKGGFEFDRDYFLADISSHRIYLAAEKASYTFWPELITGVCTEEHADVTLAVFEYFSPNPVIEIHGRVDWLLFSAEAYGWTGNPAINNTYLWNAVVDVGLKAAFGDDPAHYSPVITISFPEQGSEELNEQFFIDNIQRVKFYWKHYAWKDNS